MKTQETNTNNFYTLLFFSIISIIYTFSTNAEIMGDGAYYFSTLISIATDYYPHLSETSREIIIDRFGFDVHSGLSERIESTYYAWHFWLYPLLCLPAFWILDLLNLDILKSFQVTNAFLMILGIYWILFRCPISNYSKQFIVALLVFSTGTSYIKWSHPEIFSCVFLAMACCEFISKRYFWMTVFTAIASYQNPSIALFLWPIYAYLSIDLHFNKKQPLIEIVKKLLPLATASLLVFIPYAWNILIFGSYNPIADSHYINYSIISIDRLISFYFDLNQGAIVSTPGLFIIIPLIVAFKIYPIKNNKPKFVKHDILIVSSLIISIPVLAQLNWNPGQQVALRYVSWASIPLIFWIATNINLTKNNRIIKFTSLFVLFIQVFFSLFYGGLGYDKSQSYIEIKPWISKIWNINPHMYNPIPEIFYERLYNQESVFKDPTIYTNQEGQILKLLTKDPTLATQMLCGQDSILVPADDRSTSQIRQTESESSFTYVSGRIICGIKKYPLSIKNFNQIAMPHKGWSSIEKWGVWTNRTNAEFTINAKPTHENKKLIVTIIGSAYVNSDHPKQIISIENKSKRLELIATKEEPNVSFSFEINSTNLNSEVFKIELPDAKSPAELGQSPDTRKLGFGLTEIRISEGK